MTQENEPVVDIDAMVPIDQCLSKVDPDKEIIPAIRHALEINRSVFVKTNRSPYTSYKTIVLSCCSTHPNRPIYIRNGDLSKSDMQRHILTGEGGLSPGFRINLVKPTHTMSLGRWKLTLAGIILSSEAIVESDTELNNPGTLPKLKFKLQVMYINNSSPSRKNIVATIEDGVFMWHGSRLNALNNEEAAACVSEVIGKAAE